tara:strand:- start:195 stop:1322 length:1128 start_codon:yes stop_codon:yes gene_type:complete
MQEYNTIVLNNLTPGASEIKGSLYVGGIIAAGNPLSVNSSLMPDGSLGGSLVVGGIVSTPIQLHSGNVLVGGIVNANFNNSGGGNITVGGSVTGAITNTYGGNITIGGDATGTINNEGGGNITVSGSITNVLNNQNGGDITVGSSITSPYNNQGGGDVTVGGHHLGGVNGPVSLPEVSIGINVEDIRTRFEILSTELSTLSTNGVIEAGNFLSPDNEGGVTLIPPGEVADPNEVLVFNIDASFFDGDAPSFLRSDITTVVNVAGANFTIKDFDFDDEFENVLFNFYEAVTLNVDSTFGASILAPFADTENTSDIKGSLVTNNYINSGLVLPPVFDGDLTPWEAEPPTIVPVPASAWLFFSAIFSMVLLRRGQIHS